nr:hypothetical protein [Gammaproteobacteria bacterium]
MSKSPSLASVLCELMARACNRTPSSVSLDTRLLDLDLDSLTFVAVLAQVEALYEIEIGASEMAGLLEASSMNDLCIGLERLVSESERRAEPCRNRAFPID